MSGWFEAGLGVLGLALVIRLGLITDWQVTASEALTSGGCLLAALITVGIWHRATRRRNH